MASSTSQLIVSLIDRVSGPAKTAGQAITNLHRKAMGAAAATRAGLAQSQSNMIGALGMGYALQRSLAAPLKAAGDFQSTMTDIALKADLSKGAVAELAAQVKALAPTFNATADEAAKGLDFMIGMGANISDAVKMIAPIGKAAAAFKADITDLSKAGYAALDNLKVAATDVGKALSGMAQAGKEGGFELKDMAQYFPSLAAGAAKFKMQGVAASNDIAAALQAIRKSSGTSEKAATQMQNVLQKINSDETTKKFKKLGVDINKDISDAQKAAAKSKKPFSIFETAINSVNKALKGDTGKIGQLFQDQEAQLGMLALLNFAKEYREILAKSNDASKSEGMIDADFARRMEDFNAKTKAFMVTINGLSTAIGEALMPGVEGLMESLKPFIEGLTSWVKANPELVSGVTKVAAALIGLRIAGIAAGFAFNFLKGGALLAMLGPLALLRGAFAGIGAALLAFSSRTRLAAAAMAILRLGMLAIPGAALFLGIAAAGTWIYKNWKGLGKMFSAFFKALKDGLAGSNMEGLSGLIKSIETAWDGLTGKMDEGKLQAAGKSAGESVAESINRIGTEIKSVIELWDQLVAIMNKISNFGGHMANEFAAGQSPTQATGKDNIKSRFGRRGQDASTAMKSRATDEGSGAGIIQSLDQSGKAAAAGQSTADAYFNAMKAKLEQTKNMVAAIATEMRALLSFNASPTITPRVSPMSMPGGGQSGGGKVDRVAARHAQLSDGGNFTA